MINFLISIIWEAGLKNFSISKESTLSIKTALQQFIITDDLVRIHTHIPKTKRSLCRSQNALWTISSLERTGWKSGQICFSQRKCMMQKSADFWGYVKTIKVYQFFFYEIYNLLLKSIETCWMAISSQVRGVSCNAALQFFTNNFWAHRICRANASLNLSLSGAWRLFLFCFTLVI